MTVERYYLGVEAIERLGDGSLGDVVLEVLGWIGLVVLVLVVVLVFGAMVVPLFFDWEFGLSVLLMGGFFVSLGIFAVIYWYRVWLPGREYLHPPRFVACPFCGMKNDVMAQFRVRCGKAIPEQC